MATSNIRVGPRSSSLGSAGILDQTVGPVVNEDSNSTTSIADNALNSYASYSCIITFGVLSDREVNDPANTYRKNGPQRIIARSGGSGTKQVPTTYEKELGITAEYFIDDLEIQSTLAPTSQTKQTNANVINFTLKEPYSMGILLETLAVTARDAYPERAADDTTTFSYVDVPYVIILEFIGWDDQGRYREIANTTRYIPVKLTGVDFTVSPEGTSYNVGAVAWNEQALIDEIQTVNETVELEGSTIAEFLQVQRNGLKTLTATLNERQNAEKEAGNKPQPDQYVIAFPKDDESLSAQINQVQEQNQGATVNEGDANSNSVTADTGITLDQIKEIVENDQNINEIGQSKLVSSGEAIFNTGTELMGRPEEVFTFQENNINFFARGQIVVQEGSKSISFMPGMRIQEIIEEFVLMSEYGEKLVTEPSDDYGRKKYFRIETDVYTLASTENVRKQQKSAKIYVYKVLPYLVSESYFNHPSTSTKGIDALRERIPKKYDYMYTGQNDDIINFDLNFNTSFYAGIRADFAQTRQDLLLSRGPRREGVYRLGEGTRDTQELPASVEGTYSSNTGQRGGSGNVDLSAESLIARDFNDILLNSGADLITVDLEIWGDPYYFADSGVGNYTAPSAESTPQTKKDGTIDYQGNEPYLILNFRTPIDYNQSNDSQQYGEMTFPEAGGKPVRQFSGIYRINTVTNSISANRFTQSLQLTRLRNQTQAGDGGSLAEPGNTDNTISPILAELLQASRRDRE
jgi:hypothetical protein